VRVSQQAAQALQKPFYRSGSFFPLPLRYALAADVHVGKIITFILKMHQWFTPPSFAFSSSYRFSKLSRKEAPDGSGCTFVPNNHFNSYLLHYKTAFAFSIIPSPHIYRLVLRLAFLPKAGDIRGFHVPRKYHSEQLRFCPSTDGTTSTKKDVRAFLLDHPPFG